MIKELDSVELAIIEFEKILEDDPNNEWLERVVAGMKKCYQRLEAIDKAKPSRAFSDFQKIKNWIEKNDSTMGNVFSPCFFFVEQSLIQAQEQEKVLEILFEKKVEVNLFYNANCSSAEDYNGYIRLHYSCFIWFNDSYYLTQEEFDLLKKYVKTKDKSE